MLEKAESQEEVLALNGNTTANDEDDEEGEGPVERPLTKQQQAERLRRIVDTVGRPGQPGEQIQNVISVGMLSEGWDAKTVTHIMGLRRSPVSCFASRWLGAG